ncbi:DUF6691 family protein [Ruegeria meonggei]|uniref:DUF6691 family protein n=1 Tax=Ruegeria meonggei TaxID=1446476 RepID=UPI00366F013F
MKLLAIYLIGLIFGLGISLSGMSNPAKVLNFFDVFGAWDPSLIFVMGGALVTTFVGYKLVFGREAPVFEPTFHLPTSANINARLVGGSAVFGIGWGIAGFCPGGALPALGTGRWEVFAFVGALVIGIALAKLLQSAAAPDLKSRT